MGFIDTNETIEYRDPSWPEDSVWYFSRNASDLDDINAVNFQRSEEQIIDPEEIKLAQEEGRAVQDVRRTVYKMTPRAAVLAARSREWEGSEFIIPINATLRNGKPHPRRGRAAPCDPFWVQRVPKPVRERAYAWLEKQDEEANQDEAEFPSTD